MKVVVIFGNTHGAVAATSTGGSSLIDRLTVEHDSEADIWVLAMGLDRPVPSAVGRIDLDAHAPGLLDRMLGALGALALRERLSTFPIGKLINSVGPVDPGRVLWRKVRRDDDALALLKSADVAVAADLAGVKTAWLARRRHWAAEAYYDHEAASIQ